MSLNCGDCRQEDAVAKFVWLGTSVEHVEAYCIGHLVARIGTAMTTGTDFAVEWC